MKRIFTLLAVAAVSLALASEANAQFGFIAGITSSKTSMKDAADDVKNITLYHAGVTCKMDLGLGFAIQPSLLYQVKGANLGSLSSSTTSEDFKLKTGYLEVPVNVQWGPDLLAFRPFVFAEPFIGYQISSSDKGNETFSDWTEQAKNKVEYGIGLGGGLEITSHIQLSCQWFKNMGSLFKDGEIDTTGASSFASSYKDLKNYSGIKFSVAILF